jgi:hypothetical protein
VSLNRHYTQNHGVGSTSAFALTVSASLASEGKDTKPALEGRAVEWVMERASEVELSAQRKSSGCTSYILSLPAET